MTDRYSLILTLLYHSAIMAEAILDAAMIILAGVPEMNQVLTFHRTN
jgi:hypothetical protein